MVKKQDAVYIEMYKTSCAKEGIPVPDKIDINNENYQLKKLRNTCLDCHEFKVVKEKLEEVADKKRTQDLSHKQRKEVSHLCSGACRGFIYCNFPKVCACVGGCVSIVNYVLGASRVGVIMYKDCGCAE